jgi:uracil-DNA glycosylase
MAPRVLHLFGRLDLEPGTVPASNLVFVRSRREADIKNIFVARADQCWPFHALAIQQLKPRVIVCMGKRAGNYVRGRLGAHRQIGEFVETNNRRWRSRLFAGASGPRVVVATHPGIADWTAPSTDPSSLISNALAAD